MEKDDPNIGIKSNNKIPNKKKNVLSKKSEQLKTMSFMKLVFINVFFSTLSHIVLNANNTKHH